MKLDSHRVLSLFALFTDMPDAELIQWSGLCESAESKLMSRLRISADINKNMERLCNAAAALAFCDYVMLSTSPAGGDVKVGDISFKAAAEARDATETRDYMLAEISDLIESPSGFVFRGIGDQR